MTIVGHCFILPVWYIHSGEKIGILRTKIGGLTHIFKWMLSLAHVIAFARLTPDIFTRAPLGLGLAILSNIGSHCSLNAF